MKNLFLLAVGLLCSLLAPPGAYASVPARHDLTIVVHTYKVAPVVLDAVMTEAVAPQVVAVAQLARCATYTSAVVAPRVVSSGAVTHTYLASVATALRARPGWQGLRNSLI